MAGRPLVGLLVALAVGLVAYGAGHALLHGGRARATGAPPTAGFAGWLLALAIGQWLAVLSLLGDLLRHLPAHQQLWSTGAPIAAVGDLAGRAALLALVLCAAILMQRRSRLYPRLLRLEMIVLVLRPVLAGLLLVEDTDLFETRPKLWIGFALQFAATGLLAAAGYLYAQHSARVRATFVR